MPSDAGADGVAKLAGALRQRADADRVKLIKDFTTAQLDLALGRSNVVHAALLAGPANDTFLARLARLERFAAGEAAEGTTGRPSQGRPGPRTELTGFENGMSDTKTTDGKTLSVEKKSTLSLKPRTETGVVRQSFSHGRSKQVVVEVKRSRTGTGKDAKPEPVAAAPAAAPAAPARPSVRPAAPPASAGRRDAAAAAPAAPPPPKSGVVLRTLTEEERSRRAHALGDARLREAEERKIAEEDAKIRAQRDAIEKTERDAAEARKREEDERRKHDEATKKKADEVAKKRFGEGETAATTAAARRPACRPKLEAEEEPKARAWSAAAPAARCARRRRRSARPAPPRPRPNGRAAA